MKFGLLHRSPASASTLAIAVVLGGMMVTPASAQDAPVDVAEDGSADRGTIVVTATRTPTEIEDVPATVTVITDEDIADQLASDVRDLVRFEPGVTVRRAPSRFTAAFSSTGRGGNESFNIRGIEGNRVLIQVDGIRVPDGFSFGAQSAGRGDFVDLGLVRSVEILRGPASALYGSDGLAGAVSFFTSDPEDILGNNRNFGGALRASYDSADNEFSETAYAAGRSGNLSVLVAYTRRDGEELENNRLVTATSEAPDSRRTAPNPQDTRSNATLSRLVWRVNDQHRLRLTAEHLDSRIITEVLSGRAIAPVLSSTGVLDLDARDTNRRDRISIDWRYEGEGLVDHLQATAFLQDARNRQFSDEDRNTAADRTRINTFENRVLGFALEGRSGLTTGSVQHTLLFGGDYTTTRQRGLRDGTVPTPPDVFPTRAFPVTDFVLAGAYLGDQINIGDGVVQLFPALRFDFYDIDPRNDPLLPPSFSGGQQDGTRVSPKFGAVVQLGGGWNIFGNYGRGFQAPSPLEINQFFDNPSAFPFAYRTLRNPDLRPETSESYEAGLRLVEGPVNMSITGFTGRYRNFISQVQLGGTGTVADPILFQYRNLNRVNVEGLEGRAEFRDPSGLNANLAIAYARGTVISETGARSPLQTVDPLKLVMGVGYRDPANRFGGQLVLSHAARVAAGRVAGLCTPSCFRPPAYTILDATAFVRLGEALTLRAGVFNLTDERYIEYADARGLASTSTITDAFTQPGRNASVSLSFRF